jgi:hypothetical protein
MLGGKGLHVTRLLTTGMIYNVELELGGAVVQHAG